MNLIEAINECRPDGWDTQEFQVFYNREKLATEITFWIQFQRTNWVVIDSDGTIDAPLRLRADCEVLDEVFDDVPNDAAADDLNVQSANLLYDQILLDITDLILAGAGESQDPLLRHGEGKRFLPRDLAREMVKNLAGSVFEKIHEDSSFREEDWYKEWQESQLKSD